MRSPLSENGLQQAPDFSGGYYGVDRFLTVPPHVRKVRGSVGAIAQLGERLHGMQEVGGSIPPSSTKSYRKLVLSPHRLEA